MGQHIDRYTFLFTAPLPRTERGVKDKKGKWKAVASLKILMSANLVFNSSNTKIKDV